jgi:hypothetical protein
MNKVLTLERCQHGGVLSSADGEAGYGIYAYLPSPHMRGYYSSNGETVFEIEVDAALVVDLTAASTMAKLIAYATALFARRAKEIPGYRQPAVNRKNIQRFGSVIEQFIRENYSDAMAWIVPHNGPGIPDGKQVVIANERVILGFHEKFVGSVARERAR